MKTKKMIVQAVSAVLATVLLTSAAFAVEGTDGTENPQNPAAEQTEEWPTSFSDVAQDAWYAPAVQYVAENKISKGVEGDKFGPDLTLSRGMLATMIYRYCESPAVSFAQKFSDVNAGDYYAEAVTWACDNGIIKGYPDGSFDPNGAIIRQDVAVILYRLAGYQGKSTNKWKDLYDFYDAANISSYAADAMKWAYSYSVLNGTSATTAEPQGTATRAQCAQLIYGFNKTDFTQKPTATNLFNGNRVISYAAMCEYLNSFAAVYPDLIAVADSGYSEEGRAIKEVRLGKGNRYIYMEGNLHAREYITTNYLLELIDTYAYCYTANQDYAGYSVRNLLDNFSIIIVPCANPDGQNIATNGYDAAANPAAVKAMYNKTGLSARWKANANGVDLNRNFPTSWSAGSPNRASSEGWGGTSAFCASETQTIRNIIAYYPFEAIIDCHAPGNGMSGDYIYYIDTACSSAYRNQAWGISNAMSQASGFSLQSSGTGGGLANYGRHVIGVPSFTIEMYAYPSYPLNCSDFYSKVWDKNATIPLAAIQYQLTH